MDLKEFYNNQSEEVKAKFKACKSEAEILKVLDEEGIKLDPEILDEISGGFFDYIPILDNPDLQPKC